jgi:small subunit ribosomal protein S1
MKDTEDFEALLKQYEQEHPGADQQKDVKVGDRVRGRVVCVGEEQVFVDLGGKSEGVMEVGALTDADGRLTVNVGDTVEAAVTSIDEESGSLLLGSQHGRHLHGLADLEQAFRQQLPVEGRVTGAIKGGVEVQIAGQRAFCPASQIDIRFVEDLSELVGQHLDFRITKLEGGRRPNLVVSRRALLEEEQRALAAETRARVEEGAVLKGTVTSLKDYGAFVDLGGIEGMVHISELAYGHVKHPGEILSEGQPIEVQVLRIEQTDNPKRPEKIALSVRALARDPWDNAAERFPVGTRVKGTITRLQSFGAFVEIEPGLEGLVHVSELGAGRRVSHPQEAVASGQEVEATVLGVDTEKRRISLSLDESKKSVEAPEAKSYTDYGKPKEGFGTLGDLLRDSMQKRKS